jgi:DNA invertase Pin-like site-specific DNA recombinase
MTTSESLAGIRPAKIALHHLERWAIVYVRQSHPQQVQRHRESAQVQANLQQLALGWGWPRQRIRILEGDQGVSATSTIGRDDFAWLLSEIALGHVGLVLGFQINRLAREDEACCRLIKICKTFDTLLADQDGLYHPHDFNDRLVLTIKGLMGGFELHQLQQRMQAGRLNRARRGEWLGQVPPGYVIGPDSKLQFDPDEHVQSVIRLIFERFALLGSLSGLLRYLRQQHIELPYRVPSGPNRGQLHWHRPHRETLRSLLRRPAYAGAYTWGRHAFDPRRQVPGRRGCGRVEIEPQACAVFLPDNHSAYITWEQYQSNLRRLCQQRLRGPVPGPARETVALLAGLVVCGSCGCRMQTHYTKTLRYDCQRHAFDYGTRACQSLVGKPLEQLVAEQILEVVTPASLELSLRATAEYERERAALDKQWHLRLERARQNTGRVHRQYNAVEPDNRLVARTLERQWEESLAGRASHRGRLYALQGESTATRDGGRASPDRGIGAQPANGLALAANRSGRQASSSPFAAGTGGRLGSGVEPGSEGPSALEPRDGDGTSHHAAGAVLGTAGQYRDGAPVHPVVAGGGLAVAPHGRGA